MILRGLPRGSSLVRVLKMDLFSRIKNMKILLVDDDEWIRDSLSLFFEAEGCDLLTFETAEEGMEAVKKQAYDIVISDYKLPGMDGLEFLRRVRENQPNAFEVLITAYANCEIVKEANEIGVKDIIPKPFTSEDVETSLARIIENSA
jgi:DNA-binding NtrC family response regulator